MVWWNSASPYKIFRDHWLQASEVQTEFFLFTDSQVKGRRGGVRLSLLRKADTFKGRQAFGTWDESSKNVFILKIQIMYLAYVTWCCLSFWKHKRKTLVTAVWYAIPKYIPSNDPKTMFSGCSIVLDMVCVQIRSWFIVDSSFYPDFKWVNRQVKSLIPFPRMITVLIILFLHVVFCKLKRKNKCNLNSKRAENNVSY